ncbi:hypothetical protein ACUN0C_00610 [Faunimonas sp. B44]|uniref:hypothetical protein n=1 Tax=Faunimonas sp. B44 TaxID=3461493 RepID=UPI004043C0DB
MERLRNLAFQSIGRAVGFAGLAIFVMMAGLSYDPLLALRSGGILVLILLIILLLRARASAAGDHTRTELWLYLDKSERPAEPYARWVISTVLREAYLRFARWTAAVAAVLWSSALLLSLLRLGPAS